MEVVSGPLEAGVSIVDTLGLYYIAEGEREREKRSFKRRSEEIR